MASMRQSGSMRLFTSVLLCVIGLSSTEALATDSKSTSRLWESVPETNAFCTLNFADAPVIMVFDFLGALSGRYPLVEPGLREIITLKSEGRLSRQQAVQAIEAKLEELRIAVWPEGEKFFKVVRSSSRAAPAMVQEGGPLSARVAADDPAITHRLVSLNFKEAPLEMVLVELERMTGFTLVRDSSLNAVVDLHAAKLTVIEAVAGLESLLRMHNVAFQYVDGKTFRLVPFQSVQTR